MPAAATAMSAAASAATLFSSGAEIRRLRHDAGLSQKALAAAVPTTIRTVERWENDHVRPSLLALIRLHALLRGELKGSLS